MTAPEAEPAWQRLSPLALVFLVGRALQRFVRENLVVFLGAGAGVAFVEGLGVRQLAAAAALLLAGTLVITIIRYRRFRFLIEADSLRVRQGLLEQQELRVRFARIQHVELGEPVYFRPFGLVHFSAGTPGAAEPEVELPGIPRPLAEQLRDRLVSTQGEAATQGAAVPAHRCLYAPEAGRLFLHGLSSNQVWVVAGVLFYLLDLGMRQAGDAVIAERVAGWLQGQLAAGGFAPFLLPLLVVVVLLVAGGVLAILRFHPYRLQDRGSRLVGSGGLLERREQTLRRDRLTGVVLRQSAVGRLLGVWSLLALQTRSNERDPNQARRSFLVPGLRRVDLPLVASLWTEASLPEALEPIDGRYRAWLATRGLLFVLVLAVLLLVTGWGQGLVILLMLALAAWPLLAWLRWRHWGWHLQGSRLWLRQGLLGRRFEVFELARVQQVQLRTSLYQRRHGLATLVLVLPQGRCRLPFVPVAVATELGNLALYSAETATRHRV